MTNAELIRFFAARGMDSALICEAVKLVRIMADRDDAYATRKEALVVLECAREG